jgi:Na+-transporting NADH:ubiquinone oxidoreductase subunit C
MSNDSTGRTLTVAAILCIVCSILVSGSAVSLKPRQIENQKLDVKKNLLLACNLLKNKSATKEEIESAFKNIETKIIDLETGLITTSIDAESYNQRKAAKKPDMSIAIPAKKDFGGIKRREKFSKVFFVKDPTTQETKLIVLPIYGKGLWSTLYAFMAISPDTRKVKGLGFYQHGETPGLGGEIENPKWTALWNDKVIFDENFQPALTVVKGQALASSSNIQHEIDGLSGATITSNGVTNLVKYWLGDHAFGPYLANLRNEGGVQ